MMCVCVCGTNVMPEYECIQKLDGEYIILSENEYTRQNRVSKKMVVWIVATNLVACSTSYYLQVLT